MDVSGAFGHEPDAAEPAQDRGRVDPTLDLGASGLTGCRPGRVRSPQRPRACCEKSASCGGGRVRERAGSRAMLTAIVASSSTGCSVDFRSMLHIKVVFQGGGAKLVTLMAAASVIRDLESEGQVQVVKTVGVSAGSIAACMLASRHPWDNLRLQALQAGTSLLGDFGRVDLSVKTAWKVYRGRPLLPETALRTFVRSVFSSIEVKDGTRDVPLERLGQLAVPVSIVAASVRHSEKVVYDSTADGAKRIEDAVCDSCAIPFVFRTFTSNDLVVDGGICGNFPDTEIMASSDETPVLGFSFEEESTKPTSMGLLRYGGALVSTAMASAVRDSARRIKAGGGEVCELPLDFDTLDFESAIREGLNPQAYKQIREKIRPRLVSTLHAFRKQVSARKGKASQDAKLLAVYRQSVTNHPYVTSRGSLVVTLDSARFDGDPLRAIDDEVRYSMEMKPAQQSISCFKLGMGLTTEITYSDSGDQDFRIETLNHTRLSAARFLVNESFEGKVAVYALFFLETPVSEPVRIIQRTRQIETMPLFARGANVDFLESFNSREQETVPLDLVLWYPDHFGSMSTLDLLGNLNLLPARESASIKAKAGAWTSGRPMSIAEVDEYRVNYVPPRCEVIGWRVTDVPPKHYCGAIFVRGS